MIDEYLELISVEMKGNFFFWLIGILIRNGFGRFECGDIFFNYWFDG